MSTRKLFIISFRFFILFAIAIIISFIPDFLHNFFGDWVCKGSGVWTDSPKESAYSGFWSGCNYVSSQHDSTWHWGYRHWLFFIMGIVLFTIQVVDIIQSFFKHK